MHVTNLTSPRSDRPVANQYEITDDNGVVTFQSYKTPIANKNGFEYTVSTDWCYSVTTSKYFSQWLRSFGWHDSNINDLKKWLKTAKPGDTWQTPAMAVDVTYVEELK